MNRTKGPDQWTGPMDRTNGPDQWTGPMDRTNGPLDYRTISWNTF